MMTYQPDLGTQRPPQGWVGWIKFGAALMIVTGLFGIVEGLTGIFRDKAYFANGKVVVFDYTAWGWIHLLIGIFVLAVGIALWGGSQLARMVAIGLVVLNLLAQFLWMSAEFPWWSIISIAFNFMVLYALIVHGDELTPTS